MIRSLLLVCAATLAIAACDSPPDNTIIVENSAGSDTVLCPDGSTVPAGKPCPADIQAAHDKTPAPPTT
jgi:hypothetical protein